LLWAGTEKATVGRHFQSLQNIPDTSVYNWDLARLLYPGTRMLLEFVILALLLPLFKLKLAGSVDEGSAPLP